MAMSLVIRRSSPTVVPLALRAISTPKILTGLSGAYQDHTNGPVRFGVSNRQLLSTFAEAKKQCDLKLVDFLKSEIKSAKSLGSDVQLPQAPADFPFEIEDTPGGELKLIREIDGEKIEVFVDGPHGQEESDDDNSSSEDEDEDDDSDSDGDDDDDEGEVAETETENETERREFFKHDKPHIHFSVKISKKDGKILGCCVWANNGFIWVRGIYFEGRQVGFSHPMLPEANGQDSWRDFLASRGVDGGIVEFLMEYMVNKSKRDNLLLLRRLKKFVK